MRKANRRLDWCVVNLRDDINWWVEKISDVVNWDVEGLSIVDPKQFLQIHESLDSLTEYGLDSEVVDNAFFTFEIAEELKAGSVRLNRVRDSLLKADDLLFALPDIMDEEKGPYADFIKHITKLRVLMLNDLIDFLEPYTVENLEEILREKESTAFMEGRHEHCYEEIISILEFVPDGFKLETDLEDENDKRPEVKEEYPELETVEEAPEEEARLEKQENLRWDEEEEEITEDKEEEEEEEA